MTWGGDPAVIGHDRPDDDGLARGGGRLQDAARPHPSDGDRPSLWPGPLGLRTSSGPEWNPVYYAQARPDGIGFDRTAGGSDALSDDAPQVAKNWGSRRRCPTRCCSGSTMFPGLSDGSPGARCGTSWWSIARCRSGLVRRMQADWAGLRGKVDETRWAEVRDFLAIQLEEAIWRDASVAYFQPIAEAPAAGRGNAPRRPMISINTRRSPRPMRRGREVALQSPLRKRRGLIASGPASPRARYGLDVRRRCGVGLAQHAAMLGRQVRAGSPRVRGRRRCRTYADQAARRRGGSVAERQHRVNHRVEAGVLVGPIRPPEIDQHVERRERLHLMPPERLDVDCVARFELGRRAPPPAPRGSAEARESGVAMSTMLRGCPATLLVERADIEVRRLFDSGGTR